MVTDPGNNRPARSWLKISVTVDSSMTDAVCAYLGDLTGIGLEITDVSDNHRTSDNIGKTERITGYLTLSNRKSESSAALEKTDEFRRFLDRLQRIFPGCRAPVLDVETVIEEDWGKKWKSFFTAFHITPSLVIKPSWEELRETEKKGGPMIQARVIELDPGLAFGTGHHASTQLALLFLEELFQNGWKATGKVLDVGTGSGILAMACAIFGAEEVLAIDNDPDAVETARQNIIRNRLEDRVAVSGQDIDALAPGFDIIVANITHDILAELAENLVGRMQPGGFLVLSGILQGEQEASLRERYAGLGLKFIKNLTRDEWTVLEFRKN